MSVLSIHSALFSVLDCYPVMKQGRKKFVYRLIVMFLSTEIFSKRRKIYTWIEEKRLFHLVGIICYYGSHYFTYFFHAERKTWISYNDSSVKEIGQEWNSVVQTIERGRYQPVLLTYQRSDSTPIETGEENRNVNCNNATEDQYIALEDWGCYVSARPPNRSPDRTAYRRQLMSTSGKPEAKEIADLVALLADATIRDPRDAKVPATDIISTAKPSIATPPGDDQIQLESVVRPATAIAPVKQPGL